MAKKTFKSGETTARIVQEPAVAYQRKKSQRVVDWNPNAPVHATQEEWWEHFHRIEEGHFMTLEEFDSRFEIWQKQYLASKLK